MTKLIRSRKHNMMGSVRAILRVLAILCVVVGLSGCGNDSDEPDGPDGSGSTEGQEQEMPEIEPLSQKELNTRTVKENPGAFFKFDDVDPDDFNSDQLFVRWESDPNAQAIIGGFKLAAVQVKTDEGSVYTFTPMFTPFYISAKGTEIRLRHICRSTDEPGISLNMINKALGQGKGEVTKEEVPEYNFREADGDVYLTFPENRSDELKPLTVTVCTYQTFMTIFPDGKGRMVPAMNVFYFLQMPWTDDESVWENIPDIY